MISLRYYAYIRSNIRDYYQMSQQQWTYLSADNKAYHLGLYHGADSGHLLLHCNENPLIIDFSVMDDKEYHFYVNQEMLCLTLSKGHQGFSYNLARDDEVITPFTTALKLQNRKYNLYALALALGLLMIILLAVFILLPSFQNR